VDNGIFASTMKVTNILVCTGNGGEGEANISVRWRGKEIQSPREEITCVQETMWFARCRARVSRRCSRSLFFRILYSTRRVSWRERIDEIFFLMRKYAYANNGNYCSICGSAHRRSRLEFATRARRTSHVQRHAHTAQRTYDLRSFSHTAEYCNWIIQNSVGKFRSYRF
jgi:hypothetical protein